MCEVPLFYMKKGKIIAANMSFIQYKVSIFFISLAQIDIDCSAVKIVCKNLVKTCVAITQTQKGWCVNTASMVQAFYPQELSVHKIDLS